MFVKWAGLAWLRKWVHIGTQKPHNNTRVQNMVHAQAKGIKPKILIVQVSRRKYYLNIRGRAGGYLPESARVPAEGAVTLAVSGRF